VVTAAQFKPFINVTAEQLAFGYDDALVSLAHRFYPKHMRPMERMGLLLGRNGTLTEVSSVKTGMDSMDQFGYIDQLNGMDHLPHWSEPPCTSIAGSEGSFFPPRELTKSEMVHIYDKDLCRIIPLKYVESLEKVDAAFLLAKSCEAAAALRPVIVSVNFNRQLGNLRLFFFVFVCGAKLQQKQQTKNKIQETRLDRPPSQQMFHLNPRS